MKGENARQIEAAERQRDERLAAAKKRRVFPASLATLRPGDQVYYVPKSADRPHAMSRAEVVRGPRMNVQSPTVRLKFADGDRLSVPLGQVSVQGVRTETPPWLVEARQRPTWARLVRQLQPYGEIVVLQATLDAEWSQAGRTVDTRKIHDLNDRLTQARSRLERAEEEALQRGQQLLGIVAPSGTTRAQRPELLTVLMDAARADAVQAARQAAQRGGRGPVAPTHLPVPTDELANLRLDQEQRAMVNNIAKCIHRRYFLSDAELRDLTAADREEEKIRGTLSVFIRHAQADSGLVPVKDGSAGKGNKLHGELHDNLTRAYPLALEACQMLVAGKDEYAHTLALQVRELLEKYVQANTELDRARRKHHTGRYFHGDVLSVREEHEDGGMTQYYARLTIVFDKDGHSLVVANAAELESLTGTRAGLQAWTSLCRWIEDHSDRAGGRKQGRRQDDDEHLIYRESDDRLKLRDGLTAYPNLLRAFECIRRALLLDEREKDVLRSEIPEHHPAPGYHAPATAPAADPPEGA